MTTSGAIVLGTHVAALSAGWQACNTAATLRSAASEAIALGYRILEVPLFDPLTTPHPHLPSTANSADLWAYTALPRSAHLPVRPEHARRCLGRALEWCEISGATHLVGALAWSPGAHLQHPPSESDFALAVEVLRDCAQEAQRRGVALAIEPANRYECSFCCTLAEGTHLVRQIDMPNVHLLANAFHMHMGEASIADALTEAQSLLIGLHLAENTGGKLGSGGVVWENIWRSLGEMSYGGALIVTPWSARTSHNAGNGASAASESFRFLRAGFRAIQFTMDAHAALPLDSNSPAEETKAVRKRKRTTTKSYRTR
jgi:sugar phosphate isomerase/epimerase